MPSYTNEELYDLIIDERKYFSEELHKCVNALEISIKKDLELIQINTIVATDAQILNALPPDHGLDHAHVKMVRGWMSSFTAGVFGYVGRTIIILILVGIGAQYVSFKSDVSIDETLSTLLK